MDMSEKFLRCLVDGKFERMECPQCENTFLTNVYAMECNETSGTLQLFCEKCRKAFLADLNSPSGRQYVILEKYALGLEYFKDAIKAEQLKNIPFIRRVGVLDENDHILDPNSICLFTHDEPEFRLIYIMERLEHLDDEDVTFFNESVHEIDWMAEAERELVYGWVSERYNQSLAEDIRKLYHYYLQHKDFLAWDLHGNNLMRRADTKEIVIMDPYTLRT